jgi:hypothetical protein
VTSVTEFDAIADRRRGEGPPLRPLLKDDREWAVCYPCRKKHPLRGNNADQDYHDFCERHRYENGCVCLRVGPEQLKRIVRREERRRKALGLSSHFADNASVLEAFQTGQTLDLTAIGIATSLTAGWCSNWIDNSSNLYLDIMFWYYSQAVNTAASSQKEHVLFAPGSFASTDLPSNTAGNTATNSATVSAILTYLDYTASDSGWPIAKRVPYITTNKALQSGLFGIAKAHDGVAPLFTWLGLINAAGPTIGTGGGTPTKIAFRGVYNTVA